MTTQDRRRNVLLSASAFVATLLIWQISALNVILIPFRYFVTTIHETGHGLTALLTGGRFVQYVVYGSGAGVATTAGGARWLVIPAGYITTALFGGLLLVLVSRTRRSGAIAMALGAGFALLTVLFARSLPALLAGALAAAVLLLLGWKAPRWLNTLLLNVLAFLTGLNALLDLWGLLHSLDNSVVSQLGNVPNDAYAMAQEVGFLPAGGWAILWLVTAVGALGLAGYWAFIRPARADR